MTGRSLLAVAVVIAAIATGCGSGRLPTKPGVVRVVAAENFWGNIAAQIGGEHVEVTSIISDPNVDPHAYQSDPRDAAAIANAQLVIETGLGYDGFIDKTLAAVGGHRRVLSAEKVLHLTNPGANPHVWYSIDYVERVAQAIAGQLTQLDRADSERFGVALADFDDSLRPLNATIDSIAGEYAGRAVGYTERVPGYLIAAAHLKLGTPASFAQAIEDGNDPSPGDVATFDDDITGHKIAVLLYNAQVIDAATTRLKQLAASSHVPVVGVTETMPSMYSTFQAWQLAQDHALLLALGG